MVLIKNIKFLEFDCQVMTGKYANGQNFLQLIDNEDKQPVAMASVSIPDQPQQKNQVFIKNYSENEGIMEALMLQEVIGGPIAVIPQGHITTTVHEIL